jgi:hypothetical protein
MHSSPDRKATLSADQMIRYIDQAIEAAKVQLVVFAGGEPLLLGDDLYKTLDHVRNRGLFSRVVSNAYWAATPARAKAVVARLRASGLHELNISIDDFHLPFIKAQWVKNAFDAARVADFHSVVIAHATTTTSKFDEAALDALLGERLPRIYDEMGMSGRVKPGGIKPFLAVSNTAVLELGRGEGLDVDNPVLDPDWDGRSRRLGGCPWAVRCPAVTPTGRLVACCGFELVGNPILDIGDLETTPMATLLDQADEDLLINMIAFDGPYRIMDYLKADDPGLPFREHYGTFCELCQDLVTKPEIQQAMVKAMPHRAAEILAKREALTNPKAPPVLFIRSAEPAE